MMDNQKALKCPECGGHNFQLKYEAAYVYSYVIDEDAPGLKNTGEFFSFQYDKREQTGSEQYLECSMCRTKYPVFMNDWDESITMEALQDAINSKTLS